MHRAALTTLLLLCTSLCFAAEPAPSPTAAAAAPDKDDLQDDPLIRPTGMAAKHRTLEEIKKSGYLRILTRNNATSFFLYRGHRMGFDYELGKKLAQQLGIRALFIVPSGWSDIIPALERGEGDVIAGEMTVTEERAKQVRFADPYLETREVVVYREGAPPVKTPEDLSGKKVRVRKSSAYARTLEELNAKLKAAGKPEAIVDFAPEDEETEDILQDVARKQVDYTLADELIAKQLSAFFDELELGAVMSEHRKLAWAVRPGEEALAAEVNRFFKETKKKPDFNVLKRKYFESEREMKKRGKETVAVDGGSLSQFDPMIYAAAHQYGYDWRLVAAQIYQESRFDPERKSWCGAQGLFQIMPATAKELGVKDPTDPQQSIAGGLKYMTKLMKHFTDVPDPIDRYKMALASYNCGSGHVDDARQLLKKEGKPAETWEVVAPMMLELSKESVHGKSRYGYCRCGEPVDYVRHISERFDGYRQLVPAELKVEPAKKAKGR